VVLTLRINLNERLIRNVFTFIFEICRCKNGFRKKLAPQNSDEQVHRQNFDSDGFYSDFLNFIHLSFKIERYSFIIPRVVQIMSIIFQTGHELSIVLGNESTSASARVRLPSTIE
jgi:hypothetical protein